MKEVGVEVELREAGGARLHRQRVQLGVTQVERLQRRDLEQHARDVLASHLTLEVTTPRHCGVVASSCSNVVCGPVINRGL